MPEERDTDPRTSGRRGFTATHWSVIVQAVGWRETPEAEAALEQLCRTYWFPLYAAVRRKGYSREEAEDLVQAFFERLLEKNYIAQPTLNEASFELFCWRRSIISLPTNGTSSKPSVGAAGNLSFPWMGKLAEALYNREPFHEFNPGKNIDRRWAAVLLERAYQALSREYAAAGKGELFCRAAAVPYR